MAQYLSSETIRAAVERLSTCAANSTLTDFLIFRRALKNSSHLPALTPDQQRGLHQRIG
jgi:hypothetical protein